MGANTIEQTCHHGRNGCRNGHAGYNPEARQYYTLLQEQLQDAASPGPQGHADTDLLRSLADHISQQAVNSDGGQKYRQSSKSAHQAGRKAARSQRAIEHVIHRQNIEYRQVGINALDFLPNLWFEQVRGQRRPQHHAQSREGVLIGRNVDVRNAIDVETVTLDVLNNTHNGRPWLGWIFSEPHVSAHRILGWPILTSGAFINDGHQRFAVFILLSE